MHKISPWGIHPNGQAVDLITLTSSAGAVAEISNLGGIIRVLEIPLANRTHRNVVLGYADMAGYLADNSSMGVTVGPYANRIRSGKFTLDGTSYQLEQNEGENTLHSGSSGWQNSVYDYEITGDTLRLTLQNANGRGGHPGNLAVSVTFRWSAPLTLEISYAATTDRPTVLSMTHHSYFNLGKQPTILAHTLKMNADSYTPIDDASLPTGEVVPVAGTTFDFTKTRPIGEHFDHNFALTQGADVAAVLTSEEGDLSMTVTTDKPGLQLYTATNLGAPFQPYGGVCLETQHFPDAPNIPQFPSAVVTPDKPYQSRTSFTFSERV